VKQVPVVILMVFGAGFPQAWPLVMAGMPPESYCQSRAFATASLPTTVNGAALDLPAQEDGSPHVAPAAIRPVRVCRGPSRLDLRASRGAAGIHV
jgi:hypothetical protein